MPRAVFGGISAVLVWALFLAAPLTAQDRGPGTLPGTLVGQIVDAETSDPLVGATVVLEPMEGGLLMQPGRAGGPFLHRSRSVLTGPDGSYRFGNLPPGTYRVHIRRIGYSATSIEVDLRRISRSTVSVGLQIHPIAMTPVRVVQQRENPFALSRYAAAVSPVALRVGDTPGRPGHLMAPDVRALTYEDVVEAVTLGETDIFRAVQRLPGVSARDDYTAVMWTRGGAWDHTRVYFDGLPLYNPTHAGWLVSSVNPDAIGAAFFHPGVRDASIGEGAAGVLDLRSRTGGRNGPIRGAGEVSIVSARATMDGELPADQGGWMIAARRTYLDLATRALEAFSEGEYPQLPFSFTDVIGRLDLRFADRWLVEASGIWERDNLEGDLPGLITGNRAQWGNIGGRITLEGPVGELQGRHTVGMSGFEALIREEGEERIGVDMASPYFTERPTDNRVYYVTANSTFSPWTVDDTPPDWSVGIGAVGQEVRYDGPIYPPPRALANRMAPAGVVAEAGTLHPRRVEMGSDLWYGVLWGERRWTPGERAAIQTGVRLETGPEVRGEGRVRIAPRITMRYALDPQLSITAGWGRSFQYTQAIAAAGRGIGPELHLSYLWGLAGDDFPVIRSDVGTLGVERWMGANWVAAANGYYRSAAGMAVPDPTPGLYLNRPLFVTGRNTAYGAELSARRLTGRWTGSFSYAAALSELSAVGYRYPAPTDRTHTVDATAGYRVVPDLRLGAAFTAATGTPYTRVVGEDTVQVGQPGAQRGPMYMSTDLMVDWTTRVWFADITAYLQVRNVLDRGNAVTYQGSEAECLDEPAPPSMARCTAFRIVEDRFVNGLPRLPLLGFRVAF